MLNLPEWHNNEEWSINFLLFHEIGDQRDGLNGLTETHLVCEDTVQIVVEK